MSAGSNQSLVATPNHEPPVFLAKYRQRPNCPIRGLAQQISENRITLAGLAVFSLARALMVAGAPGFDSSPPIIRIFPPRPQYLRG